MISLKDARELAQRTLSKKRFQHTLNVEKMAVKLAEKNGVDPQKAALAALLHDIAKEMPGESLLQILKGNDIISNYAASRASVIWHGGAAAVFAVLFCSEFHGSNFFSCRIKITDYNGRILNAFDCRRQRRRDRLKG